MSARNVLIILGIVALGVLLWFLRDSTTQDIAPEASVPDIQTESDAKVEPVSTQEVIGKSVAGRPIEAYSFGTGPKELLFVGGMHGGYEWNSALLAYTFVDYFRANPDVIPEDVTVRIIPNINPDATFRITGKEGRFTASDIPSEADLAQARFNANGVDLNRNFDCKWQPQSMWRGRVVSAGTSAFSEPESAALRDYVAQYTPEAVVFWHSQANNVYASECEEGVLPQTLVVMQTYANAAGYGAVPSFDAYPITGDAEGYLASIGIPAVTVELQNRTSIDWDKNLAGVEALFALYTKPNTLAR